MDRVNDQAMFPQMKKIKDHLDRGRSITQKEATNLYGIGRLSSVIHRLKKRGERIESSRITVGRSVVSVYHRPVKASN